MHRLPKAAAPRFLRGWPGLETFWRLGWGERDKKRGGVACINLPDSVSVSVSVPGLVFATDSGCLSLWNWASECWLMSYREIRVSVPKTDSL